MMLPNNLEDTVGNFYLNVETNWDCTIMHCWCSAKSPSKVPGRGFELGAYRASDFSSFVAYILSYSTGYDVKKLFDIPVPSRDVMSLTKLSLMGKNNFYMTS